MVYTEVRAAFTLLESGMNCEGTRVGFILHGALVGAGSLWPCMPSCNVMSVPEEGKESMPTYRYKIHLTLKE